MTGDGIKLTLFAFSNFLGGQYYRCDLTRTEFLAMIC